MCKPLSSQTPVSLKGKSSSNTTRRAHLELRGILRYVSRSYGIFDALARLKDPRAANKTVPLIDIVSTVLMMFLTQRSSMNAFFGHPLSMGDARRNAVLSAAGSSARAPSRSTVERTLAGLDIGQLKALHWHIARRAYRNGTLKDAAKCTGGYRVVTLDGIELYDSEVKDFGDYGLTRHHKNGRESHYVRVCVASVCGIGGTGSEVLTWDVLQSRDPGSKDEGELTGAKRILDSLHDEMPGKFDVISADALYANAPFLTHIRELGYHAVLHVKGDNRLLLKEAAERFDQPGGDTTSFRVQLRKGEWWLVTVEKAHDFRIRGYDDPVTLMRFTHVPIYPDGRLDMRKNSQGELRRMESTVYVLCTDPSMSPKDVWTISRLRWDIEDCCFHPLATTGGIKHLYSGIALEQMLAFLLLAHNLRTLYLLRFRGRDFLGGRYLQVDFVARMLLDLQKFPLRLLLYDEAAA